MINLQSRAEALHNRLIKKDLWEVELRYEDGFETRAACTSETMKEFRSLPYLGDTAIGYLYTAESRAQFYNSTAFINRLYINQEVLVGGIPSNFTEVRRRTGLSLYWSINVYTENDMFVVNYQSQDYFMAVKILHNGVFIHLEDFLNMEKLTLYDLI